MRDIKYWYLYLLITFPLSAIVNLAIKRYIGLALFSLFNLNEEPKLWPLWFLAIANLIAPLTEELIKILPVIISSIRNSLQDRKLALIFGLLFGFGFGIGEAWYLAHAFSLKMPDFASGSFWTLIGFFSERTMVVMTHGFLTAIVLRGFNRNFIKYYLIAVSFHYVLNIGPGLFQKGLIPVEIAYIPIMITFFVLFKYVFKIEQQLRKENPIPTNDEILYKRRQNA